MYPRIKNTLHLHIPSIYTLILFKIRFFFSLPLIINIEILSKRIPYSIYATDIIDLIILQTRLEKKEKENSIKRTFDSRTKNITESRTNRRESRPLSMHSQSTIKFCNTESWQQPFTTHSTINRPSRKLGSHVLQAGWKIADTERCEQLLLTLSPALHPRIAIPPRIKPQREFAPCETRHPLASSNCASPGATPANCYFASFRRTV